jgi:hypothetical protein
MLTLLLVVLSQADANDVADDEPPPPACDPRPG